MYRVPCSPATYYVGETNQQLKKRFNRHIYNTKVNNTNDSGLFKHSLYLTNTFDFQQASIIHNCNQYNNRIIIESLTISSTKSNVNAKIKIGEIQIQHIDVAW